MFKSILRTLPTLSGNFKLNCNVTKINEIENNIYNGYINTANIIPLNASLLNNGIKVALLNDSYEFDVAKYYYQYNDNFYKNNFLFDKEDFQILDKYNTNYSRNTFFEFGCDRSLVKSTGYQFCFYAPIYCDDYNSLPDYFEISITLNNNLTKKLRIQIKDNSDKNYLRVYLKKYLNKIDSNVINMISSSKQATYDGINVKHGGLIKHTDDIISQIYQYQMTINNFDYLLCTGFKRNNLIMKQIIPLAFSFNIDDILTDSEKIYYKNSTVNIIGNYVKNKLNIDFYDFRYDYFSFIYKYLKYDNDSKNYIYKSSSNILDNNFPSLKEKRYIAYKYSNKLTPEYCSWKLKYSSDDYPYYTNLNYSFSTKENNEINNKYGEFPILSIDSNPKGISENSNLLLLIDKNIIKNSLLKVNEDIEKVKNTYNYIYSQYNTAMNNYISYWYNLYKYFDYKFSWTPVNSYKVYYNGILYNLYNIYNKYKIKKFGVFVNPEINILSNDNNNIIGKYVINTNEVYKNKYNTCVNIENENHDEIYIHGKIYNINEFNNSYVQNNLMMISDFKYGKYKKINNYYNSNKYYLYNDIFTILKSKKINGASLFSNIELDDIEKNYMIDSFELLDIYNISNLFTVQDDKSISFFTNLNQNNKIPKNLYYSYNSDKKQLVSEYNINILNSILANINTHNSLHLFLRKNFIAFKDVDYILNEKCKKIKNINIINDILNEINNLISNQEINIYNYIPINILNHNEIKNYFIPTILDKEYVYVDTYNLVNLIPSLNISDAEQRYAKFMNKEHIYEYIMIKNDKDNIINYDEYIFIRERKYISSSNDIKLIDTYTKLTDFFKSNLIDIPSLDNFIKSLEYNNEIYIYTVTKNNITKKYYFDLYFKEKFIKLNDELYNYMFNVDKTTGKTKYFRALYLYNLNNNGSNKLEFLTPYNSNNDKNINPESLNPILSNVWNDKKSDDYIKYLFDNKIIYAINKNNKNIYLYKKENNDAFITLSKNDIDLDIINPDNINIYDENVHIIIDEIYNNIKKLFINSGLIDELQWKLHNIQSLTPELNSILSKFTITYNNTFKDNVKFIYDIILNIIINPKNELEYNIRKILTTYLYNNQMMPLIYSANNNIYTSFSKSKNAIDYINNINIEKRGDEYYAYYLFNVTINNTNKSFNIYNSKNDNELNYYSTINGEDIYNYVKNNFNIIQPFILGNIFMNFKSSINTIVDISQLKLDIKYIPEEYDNGKTNNSHLYNGIFYDDLDSDKKVYNIRLYNSKRSMNMNRYLDDISPVLYKVSNNILNNVFNLYYKDISTIIHSNNIYKNDINIYKYPGIKYCDKYNSIYNDINIINYNDFEYKYYNDNKLYNLEKEIIISLNKDLTYEELLNAENEENIINEFKKYLKLSAKNTYNDNEILFLYNKYDIQCLSEVKKLNSLFNKKLYSLKYKLTLK